MCSFVELTRRSLAQPRLPRPWPLRSEANARAATCGRSSHFARRPPSRPGRRGRRPANMASGGSPVPTLSERRLSGGVPPGSVPPPLGGLRRTAYIRSYRASRSAESRSTVAAPVSGGVDLASSTNLKRSRRVRSYPAGRRRPRPDSPRSQHWRASEWLGAQRVSGRRTTEAAEAGPPPLNCLTAASRRAGSYRRWRRS